jgi:hypothetical protein
MTTTMTTTMTMTTYERKILALLERLVEAKEKAAAASWGWAHTIAALAFVVSLATFALAIFNARREIAAAWNPAKAEDKAKEKAEKEERTRRLVKAKLDKEEADAAEAEAAAREVAREAAEEVDGRRREREKRMREAGEEREREERRRRREEEKRRRGEDWRRPASGRRRRRRRGSGRRGRRRRGKGPANLIASTRRGSATKSSPEVGYWVPRKAQRYLLWSCGAPGTPLKAQNPHYGEVGTGRNP